MLSTENDSRFPQLKNASDDDDRPFLSEVDLPLPYPAVVSDAHLSKFSIRDYVFTARSKDIKTNWPFSQKSLRLCLDHGVKELLPPFQSSDTLGNLSVEACGNKNITSKEESTSNTNAEPSKSKYHSELDPADITDPVGQQAKGCSTETLSSWSGEEKEFPPTATSVSQSEIESVQINKPSYSPLEADTSLGIEAEVSTGVGKSENTAHPLGRKCKLIVNFGSNAERNSAEDIASNYTCVSEMVASKVCPVCKTFTSSSNTTLNAHIDQCLTVDPTPNWTTDAKLTRHKIKPRKIRLTTDIYATAKSCTLEELDKRNGRNCSTVPSLPPENDNRSELSGTRKMQLVSPHKPEDKGDAGAVYIDASGTKVRILSKSIDVPLASKVAEESSPKNPVRGIQSEKGISKKRKRHHLLKHHKYLHLTTQRNVSSHKFHSSQMCNMDQQLFLQSDKNEIEMQNQIRPSYAGVLQSWVCSKRTVAVKKVNRKVHGQHSKANQLLSQEMVVSNTRLASRNQPPDIAASVKISVPCKDQSKERKGNVICAMKESTAFKQTLHQKNVNCPAILSRINENVDRSLPQMKEKASLWSKDGNVNHLPGNIGLGDSSLAAKFTVADVSSVDDSYHGSGSNTQLSGNSGEVTVNAVPFKRKFLSFGSRSAKTAYKENVSRKSVSLRNLHEHASPELDEERAMHSEIDQPCMRSTTNIGKVESRRKSLFRVGTVLETKQASGATSFCKRRKGMVPPQDRLHDAGGNRDACFGLSDSQEKTGGSDSDQEIINTDDEDINVQRSSKGSLRHGARTLTESMDPEFQMLGNKNINRHFKADQPFCKVEGLISSAHSRFLNECERPCTFEADDEMVRESNCTVDELGSELGEENTFSNVDPIPIPGPPGSFLPSPGGTNLEEFQGNSLTTTDILSSADQHDLNEGDSSDSLISATITKSNSTASVIDKSSGPFCLGLNTVKDVTRTVASGASFETSVGNKADGPQINATMERINFDETLNGSIFFAQKQPLGLQREDSHPCCYHRKERHGHVSYNFEKSQLLKCPTMAPSTMPMTGRQMDIDTERKSRVFDMLPDEFSLTCCASTGSLNVSTPRTHSLERHLKKSPDAGPSPGCSNSDSISSSSNPTLRLMGKNLMVVNKDDDSSMPLGPNPLNPLVCSPVPQISTFTATPPRSMQNHSSSSYHMSPQNAVNVVLNPEESMKQCYSMKLAKSMNIQSGLKAPQISPVVTTGFLNQRKDLRFKPPMDSYERMDHYYINTRPNQLKNSSIVAPLYHVERVQTMRECQKGSVISAPTSMKEIIFIDDIPKKSIEMSSAVAHHHREPMEHHVFSHGMLNSAGRRPDPINLHSSPGALSMVHEVNINGTPSRQVGGVSVRWSCIPESMGGLNQNPFIAGSSSADQLRSVIAKPLGFTCRRPY